MRHHRKPFGRHEMFHCNEIFRPSDSHPARRHTINGASVFSEPLPMIHFSFSVAPNTNRYVLFNWVFKDYGAVKREPANKLRSVVLRCASKINDPRNKHCCTARFLTGPLRGSIRNSGCQAAKGLGKQKF